MKFGRQRRLAKGVNLVDGQGERLPRATQHLRELLIKRHHARPGVYHQNQVRRFVNRDARLPEDFGRDQLFLRRNHAAGIHHLE